MSNTYRIHGSRFLRKYTAAEKSSNFAYMADVRKIADTLCKVPWDRVSADVAATNTIHTEEGLDWNAPERERFDAAEWCAEHSDGFHRAYAQAACYVFKLPDSAVGKAIEKIRVNVTSDPYNPYGARIAAMTSATLDIPMDCATVREGEVFRAPDEDGMGAAPRLFRNNADGTQTWYSNSEIVDLEPGETLTAKRYLFVFVCLENYNRGRDGWIEGSSYIDNDVELTLSAAASDLVEDELNDLTISGFVWEIVKDGHLPARERSRTVDGVNQMLETGIRFLTTQNDGSDCPGRSYHNKFAGISREGGNAVWEPNVVNELNTPCKIVRAFDMTCDFVQDGTSHNTDRPLMLFAVDGVDCAFPEIGLDVVQEYWYNRGSRTYSGLNASLVSAARGGITAAYLKKGNYSGTGYNIPWDLYVFTNGGGSLDKVGTLTWDKYGKKPNGFSVNSGYVFDSGLKVDYAVPYLLSTLSGGTASNGVALLNVSGGLIREVGGMAGDGFPLGGISYSGTITSIHAAIFNSSDTGLRFIVSGVLRNVGGVTCSHCALVTVGDDGSVSVSRPFFDAGLSLEYPESIEVVPVTQKYEGRDIKWLVSGRGFIDYGGVRRYAIVSFGVSAISSTGVGASVNTGYQNKLGPDSSCRVMFGTSDTCEMYTKVLPNNISNDTAYYDGYERRIEDADDGDIVNGLRVAFARFENGEMRCPSGSGVGSPAVFENENGRRNGVAFSLQIGTEVLSAVAGDVVLTKNVKYFGIGSSVLVVPYSTPGEKYGRLVLDWSGCNVTITKEARLNVWFKPSYLTNEYPDCTNPLFYNAKSSSVDGWVLVGTVCPYGKTSAELPFDAASSRFGSFMLTGYIDVSELNTSGEAREFIGLGKMRHLLNDVATDGSYDVSFPADERGFIPDMKLIG